jgi:hypothetical protein
MVETVVLVSAMLPEPNEIARVFELLETKRPVLKVNPARLSVPCVRVVAAVAVTAALFANVTVMPAPLIVRPPRAYGAVGLEPVLVIVPDAKNVGTTLLTKTPVLLNDKLPHALYIAVEMVALKLPIPMVKFLI